MNSRRACTAIRHRPLEESGPVWILIKTKSFWLALLILLINGNAEYWNVFGREASAGEGSTS